VAEKQNICYTKGMKRIAVQLRDRGVVVIPAELRKELGLDEGSLLLIERRDEGLFLRPAVAVPVEHYTPERQAEFLLNDAVDAPSYARARQAVQEMGLDPDAIPHERPPGTTDSSVSGRERPPQRRAQT
jgi:AbrB family looped-hinge helix DNA binding protein